MGLAVGIAACGGGSGSATKTEATSTSPSAVATITVSAAPTTTAATPPTSSVKLSEKWGPKLDALANGGITACKGDVGRPACETALTNDLDAYSGILNDIQVGDPGQYPKTLAELEKIIPSASAYSAANCPGSPSSRSTTSKCYKDAVTVAVGLIGVKTFLQVDETEAGTS